MSHIASAHAPSRRQRGGYFFISSDLHIYKFSIIFAFKITEPTTPMNKRQTRLALIVKILLNNSIGSQEELMDALERNGCNVTQATLSRDLKSLRTSKVATELGGYRYVIAANGTAADEVATQAMNTVRQAAILSIAANSQMVVVKTRNGYAGGVAYDIDEISSPYLLGTIAGADTVFVALSKDAPLPEIYELFKDLVPPAVLEKGQHYFL